MSTIETINKVHETLDGYEVRFDGTDDEVLIKAGATRLTETKDIETMSRGFILTETERNAMPKTSTTIPAFAGRLSAFLTSKGISKDNRFVLDSPVHLMQVIDMPGVLDFAEPTVNAIYPEDGTVVLVTENGSLCRVTDQDDDYGDGNYIRTHWNLKELKAIFEPLDETLNQTKHLCKRLSEAVPVGTLVLPEDTKVSFLDADDNHRWFDLLSVTTEKGQALVTYRDGGTTFTDYARDLPPEDIREVLKAVGH